MKEKLMDCILSGRFDEGYLIIKKLNYDELIDTLSFIAYETDSIEVYFFILSIIDKDESADNHYLAADILCTALCYLTGAYNAALYHARKASQLAPNDISYLEHLLLYYNIPERLISDDEALKIANIILAENPTHISANRIKKRLIE